jgi:hypothetical protein
MATNFQIPMIDNNTAKEMVWCGCGGREEYLEMNEKPWAF